jgi:hypothetical protein
VTAPKIGDLAVAFYARTIVTGELADGEPMLQYDRNPFQPATIEVTYEDFGDGWEVRRIQIMGRRIRRDGTLGHRIAVSGHDDEIPPWAALFADTNRPT